MRTHVYSVHMHLSSSGGSTMQFENQVALITGGGGGIGRAAAQRFLDEGARVVLSGTRQAKLEAARDALDPSGERVHIHAGQVTTREQAHALVAAAIERFGRVDVLVNSTGIFRIVPFLEQAEGAIVNVGSMWAVDAIATTPTSAYSAAQAGRHALTKNLALELAPEGIRVNTVALAFVETPAYERFLSHEEAQEVLDAVSGFHPLNRRGQPSDVVEAILFLAGSGAGWITGTTLPVDGGVLAGRSPALHAEVEAAA